VTCHEVDHTEAVLVLSASRLVKHTSVQLLATEITQVVTCLTMFCLLFCSSIISFVALVCLVTLVIIGEVVLLKTVVRVFSFLFDLVQGLAAVNRFHSLQHDLTVLDLERLGPILVSFITSPLPNLCQQKRVVNQIKLGQKERVFLHLGEHFFLLICRYVHS
jgi:hypothetical protein